MKAGLYFHVPFCVRKCRYCSFNSIPSDKGTAKKYVLALLKEMDMRSGDIYPVSVYVGGGTPTVLPMESLCLLLESIRANFNPEVGTELTVEANPGTLARIDFSMLKDLGVNRVSLGAQSFDPEELRILGRIHGPDEIKRAVDGLRTSGIDNISLDLIYSLPGQGLQGWQSSLNEAIGLSPEHISLYDLSIEEGTEFHAMQKAGLLTLPPETVQVEMYLAAVSRLSEAGYERYEISNFARPGRECVHNLNYWSAGDFIGFGAGAHSRAEGKAIWNVPDVARYIERLERGEDVAESSEVLTPEEREREFLMLGLRKSEGFLLEEYETKFGKDFLDKYGATAMKMADAGYMVISEGKAFLTMRGVLASNRVITDFF
jgi:oxygen-independent coproporphyrinogen III oxidase